MAGRLAPPAPSNRASGPVRAGQPSRPRSRSLILIVFELQLSIYHRHRRTLSWSSSSCSTALALEPFLPSQRKRNPGPFSTMFGPDDLAARVPHTLGEARVLPNTFGLPVAVEGKHPEHIIKQVQKALPKYEARR
jgi:hypothetical protein